jgi:3-oxoacyl-[acyl-carrier-protein] synthase I
MVSKTQTDIIDFTLTTCLGQGKSENLIKLRRGESGLSPCTFEGASSLQTWTGEVRGVNDVEMPAHLKKFDCRNNRLALLGLEQDQFMDQVKAASVKFGSLRVGVIMGTSTSGIAHTERAYFESLDDQTHNIARLPDWYHYRETHNVHSISRFVQSVLGLGGYNLTISTACSSSAKVFASASRALASGACDAVVVGGVDSLCLTTLFGFNSLQLTSADVCRPCDVNRAGISIGEAAGFALVTRNNEAAIATLAGYGESADAHHMSSPHPEGKGAYLAMQAAIQRANLGPSNIGYLNLHGTGTKSNDSAECMAISNLFGRNVPCSSTKGFTGHTLGACGIVESSICLLALQNRFLPLNLNLETLDPEIAATIVSEPTDKTIDFAMTNSFGFGGNNSSLIFKVAP